MNGSLGCSDAKNFTLATDASQYQRAHGEYGVVTQGLRHSSNHKIKQLSLRKVNGRSPSYDGSKGNKYYLASVCWKEHRNNQLGYNRNALAVSAQMIGFL